MAKFCPECGTSAEGAKFCPECGTALDGEKTAPASVLAPTAEVAADEEERELWSGQPDRVFASMGERSEKYVLTNERLRVESGALRKKSESLDLWRVQDVTVKKSLTQRSRGSGDVIMKSADASTPSVELHWIKEPEALAETIRKASREARHRHGVVTQERL